MGPNISKAVSEVTQNIDNEIVAKSGASAVAQCSIQTGDITLRGARRCNVRNENRCGASASASLDAMSSAAADAFSRASVDLQAKLLPGINVSDSRQVVESRIRNTIRQNCEADARAALNISAGNITLEDCEDSNILNINTGNAAANCGIRSIIDTIVKANNELAAEAAGGTLADGIYGNNLLYGSGASVICSVCCSVLCVIVILAFVFMSSGLFSGLSSPPRV